jgi:Uma2 family endonuclease
MPVANLLLTAEEFGRLPDHKHAELINGEVIYLMPPNPIHGIISTKLAGQLNLWSERTGAGVVGTDGGFILGRNPDRVRGPDVWFISQDRMPEFSEGFWEIAPDIVAEIISASDTVNVIKEKLQDYFRAGTKLVLLLYPRHKQVEAYNPDGTMKNFDTEDRLETPLLPGFSCKVSDLFL